MLTPELVRARAKDGALQLSPLSGKLRSRAIELAEQVIELGLAGVGESREQLEAAWSAIECTASERKIVQQLVKLVGDRLEVTSADPKEAAELREAVFSRAARVRQSGEPWSREAILADVAAERGLDAASLEQLLYADLRAAQKVLRAPRLAADVLVDSLEIHQVQAALLRAVRVVADISCPTPREARALFRALKFRRLLHTLERIDEQTYRVLIDGPFSLFESVTKYGLELALVYPALTACGSVRLAAELRWGKERKPLLLRHESARLTGTAHEPELSDDLEQLRRAFAELGTSWTVAPSAAVLEVPGLGLCVPDLELSHPGRSEPVYFELLGFWSREAVWKRVELVERGLPGQVVFGVQSRLRVSEEVLGDDLPSCLLVFKGSPSARALARKLEELQKRRRRVV